MRGLNLGHEPDRPSSKAFVATASLLLVGTFVLWRSFNAPPGRVGLEFPFDLIYYYVPMLQQAAERLRSGDLPLWNPYQCCGVPFMATPQVAVFYPPTWITLFMPVEWAVKTLMFGQVFLAGLFAALYFRSLDRSWFAAGTGGLLFLFGCVLGQVYWPSEVSTLAWMPFLFWTVERFVQTGRPRWWMLFTLGTAMQVLAGFPQFLVYTFYLLVPYTLLSLWLHRSGASSGLTRAGMLLLGSVLAVGLAAVQLIPTLELVRQTARNDSLDEQAVHYLEAQRESYMSLPRFFENMFDPGAKMITFDFPDGSGYLGMAVPLLVGLGLLLHRRDRRIWFFVAAAVVSFVLAFGYNDYSGWLYRLYAKLPTGNLFRTPSRFLVLTYFSVIWLAVAGLDRVGAGLREFDGRPRLRGAAALLAAGLLAAGHHAAGALGLNMAVVMAMLVFAAYFTGSRPVGLSTIKALLFVAILIDLAGATAPYGSLRDIPLEYGRQLHWAGVAPVDAATRQAAVAEAGLNRVAFPSLRPTKVTVPPVRHYAVTEYEPLLIDRWRWINDAMDGEHGFVMCMIDPASHGGFYDMASVTHLFHTGLSASIRRHMERRQWATPHRRPLPAPAGMKATLRRRPGALPRAYLVGRYELCTPGRAFERFVAADFDYANAVILEQAPGMPNAPTDVSRLPAEIVDYRPERVEIRTDAPGPRLCVLTDTYYPGWRATIDGEDASILRANYLFRAVVVPAGSHEVVFEYRPASFRAGAIISIGSLLLIAAIAVGMCRLLPACGAQVSNLRCTG